MRFRYPIADDQESAPPRLFCQRSPLSNSLVGLDRLAVFVDSGTAAIASIRANARALAPLRGEVLALRQDARAALPALAAQGRRFDVVYLDPPYDSDLYEWALAAIDRSDLLAEGGVVVAEHFHKRVLPETIGRLLRRRAVRVGDHVLGFYEMESGSP